MLSSASDYKYNADNLSADQVDIQGRIIPTEDIDGDTHPLRRENLAYLSEMICERLPSQQMTSNPFWSVPSLSAAPLTPLEPSTIGAKIRELYQHNSEQTSPTTTVAPVEFFPRDCALSDFPPTVDSRPNQMSMLRVNYANQLLQLSDCVVPETMPSPLSLDYMRRMFYAMEFMTLRTWATTIEAGTVGGTRKAEGYAETADGQGNITTTSISESANANQGFANENDTTCGYRLDLNNVGTLAQNYRCGYLFYDRIHPSASYTSRHVEIWYETNAAVKIIASDLNPLVSNFNEKILFFRGLVERRTSMSTSSTFTFSAYTFPVENYTRTVDANGDIIFKIAVDKQFWRNAVQGAFPSADLQFTGSDIWYEVYPPIFAFVVDIQYPSRLPVEWTWEPAEGE